MTTQQASDCIPMQHSVQCLSPSSAHQVADDAPLMAAGLDSLGAVELKNMLERDLGTTLPATLTIDHPTAAALTGYIASRVLQTTPTSATYRTPAAVLHQPQSSMLEASEFGFEAFEPVDERVSELTAGREAAVSTQMSLQQVEHEVSNAVSSVVGHAVAADAALMASGVDSLGSVELHNILQDRFDLVLPATLVSGTEYDQLIDK